LRALLAATAVELVTEEWRTVATAVALDDVDTPADVARLGLSVPSRGE